MSTHSCSAPSIGFACNVFLGIPYARPPVKNGRFKAPRPHVGWPGVLIANQYRSACIQPTRSDHFLDASARVSEDCLYLNVFSPNRQPVSFSASPVFLWVHGGGFVYGTAASLHPQDICQKIVSHGVIVVTVNYRLGPFGFLNTNETGSDSNIGLRDVYQALQWTHENIASFGGDSDRITLGGHGSGAAIVSSLSLNPFAANLLDRILLMSGSVLSPWAITNHSTASTEKLISAMGCGQASQGQSPLKCLRTQSAGSIIASAATLWSLSPDPSFFPEAPKDMLKTGKQRNVPTLMGLCKDEAAFLVFQKLANISTTLTHNSFFGRLIPEFVSDFLRSKNLPLSEALKFHYFSWHPDGSLYDYLETSIQLYTDFLYRASVLQEAVFRSQLPESQVLVYSFAEKARIRFGPSTLWQGSPHGVDILNLWGPSSVRPHRGYFEITEANANSALPFLVISFVTNRTDPSSSLGLVRWTPFTESRPFLLELGDKIKMVTADLEQKMKFWTQFLPRLMHLIQRNLTLSSNSTLKPVLSGKTSTKVRTSTTAFATSSSPTTSASQTILSTTVASSNAVTIPSTTESEKITTRSVETQAASPPAELLKEINKTVLWLMVCLALIFFLLFLFTAGACAAWHRQSYHPRTRPISRKSRHHNAATRRLQPPISRTVPVLSPPIPPRPKEQVGPRTVRNGQSARTRY